ncbi:DUF1906 domain-containing protein [Paenibacillus filicis]|uniref:DUF1906 domain-containing protein n=1 Tax=Paenibacillus gyeongsangnamensis TaxID=3388067 RepID=A0ABT4Q9B2_9BACL|nr:glycoside hydrolase domain-containing protein [Paenibacillus filicis]MCZ8513462.1 DUF1906 domain-containing protein [Paenibacillus filicis]
MAKGFDCATPLTADKVSIFAAQGFTFAVRYLADVNSWKRLSSYEAQRITDAGLSIVSIFERYPDRCREGDWAGEFDGKLALQYARGAAQPVGSAIYFAVDYNARENDFNRIEAYMRSADRAIEGYELGVYGSYAVVKAMAERGVTAKLMQTRAWSKQLVFEGNSLYQHDLGQDGLGLITNGIRINLCESDGDAGGWRAVGECSASSSRAARRMKKP